ncbi:LysR family transcriptional regulator [Bordetella bronchiseptica]|uniref:LysR-family transcriptional regulator n=1 Tax=Bordetella bronchiseptica (strain ATCC BAA-588 / NCTC 13252 / RB50) TaxID=257310 RepID=A0A0H3LRI3_BORBR|nr:LysR family transcriptional regulator [Bordetella bronchiseptica]KAK61834.1 LysR substrate-binding domain protein [Bordetella bronchiseptica 980-2]AMG90656.1 LysR family transcriptional regulator [Bordetella bronchiseptica]AWP82052.1 LysR family transcriptional regulator [Bordetella bronchiseptica]AWP86847.1 LysR family transcriptional regulator [Bordetella bronchiseptica]AWQ12417.1 LysR family transcriptional regulator [Bordetella bronchiseptica]
MKLNLRQIEVFRAVMITGSIRGASELLFVSQPAVSRLLSHMEQRIGFALFERIRGRLYATLEARKLFHEVEAVYAGVQRVNDMARDLFEHQEGILNLVASPSLGQMLIPAAIAQYRQAHPQVKLSFHHLTQAPLTERLLKRQADLALTILPAGHPNLEQEEIGAARMVLICPPGHPLAGREPVGAEALAPYPLVAYERGSAFGQKLQAWFDAQSVAARPVIEVGSPQNACALVQAGAGVALVDEFSARSWPGAGFVMRPVRDLAPLTAYLLRLREEPASHLMQSFIETLRRVMRRA